MMSLQSDHSKMTTTETTSTNLNKQTIERTPFVQFNLEQIPDNLTKVTLQHECYRLVPDDLLSPDNDDDPSSLEMLIHSTPNNASKRRQLPKIPSDKKPFGKLWQMGMSRIDQTENLKKIERNLRWKLAMTNMLLEIKTDPSTGKTLSIKMLNDDDDEKHSDTQKNKENILSSTQIDHNVSTSSVNSSLDHSLSNGETSSLDTFGVSHLVDDMTMPTMQVVQSSRSSQICQVANTTNSDSGISSNIQSPSVTFNEKIEFFENKSNIEVNDKQTKLPEASHRALFKFCARHPDEIDLQIGDAIYIYQEFDDQWSEGINLRTGHKGIFPTSLVIDVNYSEFMFEPDTAISNSSLDKFPCIDFRIQRERFILDFLGSIEVFKAKGEDVLNESIRRISMGANPSYKLGMEIPFHCLLEISDIGIRMCEASNHSNSNPLNESNDTNKYSAYKHDYFFALVQITYCGYQYKNNQYYFAFITRHPLEQARFACHVFQSVPGAQQHDHNMATTRDVAEAVGRAFHRFYNRFVQITLPMDNMPF